MALNFPDPATQTPVNTFSPSSTPSASTNGITYLWDGQKWNAQTNGDAAFWQRVGTTLSPATVGDNISTTGDLTTADATVDTLTSNGLVDAPVGTFSGDVQVGSLNSGPLAGFRNQILNPQFEITQRGTTSDTAGAFTCDRWRNNSNREQVVIDEIGQIPGNYSSGISSVNAGDTLSIRQSIELPVDKNNNCQSGPFSSGSEWIISLQVIDRGGAGGTITPTLGWSDSSAGSGTVATDAPIAAQSTTSAWTKYTFAVRIDGTPATSDRCLNLNLVATGTGTPAITAVQLEPGPVATPFEHRPVGTELALCQRYYQTIGSTPFVIPAPSATDNWRYYRSPRTATMRTAPTETGTTNLGTYVPAGTAESIIIASNCQNNSSVCQVSGYTADAEL